ncbi:winged helix-turn-helix transcriptional regulator [Kutzneria sp. CA-103260]|uniref:winged helix-turn-helix transcriptional regulator n=1 Tax=Kutzneria sp. CA-103260 TaxID=2802641 RepID=UPI0020120A8A|nr:helix-turn-helix domain-containing protein [Kutzneria sp. CA-103260]
MAHQTVSHAWDAELVPSDLGRTRRPEATCPVEVALAAIGGRWTTLVLRDLMSGPRSFTELADGLPTLSAKVLTERLAGLEQQGLVARRRLGGFPARTEYRLTEAGQLLRPLLVELYRTGEALLAVNPR